MSASLQSSRQPTVTYPLLSVCSNLEFRLFHEVSEGPHDVNEVVTIFPLSHKLIMFILDSNFVPVFSKIIWIELCQESMIWVGGDTAEKACGDIFGRAGCFSEEIESFGFDSVLESKIVSHLGNILSIADFRERCIGLFVIENRTKCNATLRPV